MDKMTVWVQKRKPSRKVGQVLAAATARLCAILALTVLYAACLGMLTGSAQAADKWGKRYALVIGNSNYKSVEKLPNPVRDATDVAAALKRLKFDVTMGTDLTSEQLASLLARFKANSKDADTVLFYYAGHGFQLDGSNFLVPVDARLDKRDTLSRETMALNDVIAALNDRKHQTIVLLDACRNNPLPQIARREGDQKGLAQMQTGNGIFIAFATKPGDITRDGRGRNSPFTRALLTYINEPKTSISDLMINVRNEVETETLGSQTPWDQSSLRNQFYFNPNDHWTGQTAALQPAGPGNKNDRLYDTGRSVGLSEPAGSGPGLIISGSGPAVPVTPAAPKITASPKTPATPQSPGLTINPQPPRKDNRTVTASLPPAYQPQIPFTPADKKALAIRVQKNLQRLGCFTDGRADGNWTAQSELALGRYYRARSQPIESLSPSEELARKLELQSGIVCTAPAVTPKRIVKRPPPTKYKRPLRKRPRDIRPSRKKVVKTRPARPANRRPVAKKKIKLKGIFR